MGFSPRCPATVANFATLTSEWIIPYIIQIDGMGGEFSAFATLHATLAINHGRAAIHWTKTRLLFHRLPVNMGTVAVPTSPVDLSDGTLARMPVLAIPMSIAAFMDGMSASSLLPSPRAPSPHARSTGAYAVRPYWDALCCIRDCRGSQTESEVIVAIGMPRAWRSSSNWQGMELGASIPVQQA